MKKIQLNSKVIKGLSAGTTVLGLLVSLITSFVNERQLDNKISEAVAKAITEQTPNN